MPVHTAQAVKIRGTILDFNVAQKIVEIRTDKGKLLKCSYDPHIEEQITDALNFIVEATGYLSVAEIGQGKEIRRVIIKGIVIEDLDFESLGLKLRSSNHENNLPSLLAIVGMGIILGLLIIIAAFFYWIYGSG